jgi:hypothetical protein
MSTIRTTDGVPSGPPNRSRQRAETCPMMPPARQSQLAAKRYRLNPRHCLTTLAVVSDAARHAMEALMATPAYKSEFVDSLIGQGLAQGKADTLLIPLPPNLEPSARHIPFVPRP